MSILIDESTRILVLGITGREAVSFTRDTLDYGGRVVAGVTPGRGGCDVHGVPVYDTVRAALAEHGADAAVIAVPPRALREAAFECIAYAIPLLVIVTERVPRLDAAQVVEQAARAVRARDRSEQHGPDRAREDEGEEHWRARGGHGAELRRRRHRHHVTLGRDDDRDREPPSRGTASASPPRSRSAATPSRDPPSPICCPSSRPTPRRTRS